MKNNLYSYLFVLVFFLSCTTDKIYIRNKKTISEPTSPILKEFTLIGDAGEDFNSTKLVFELAAKQIKTKNSSLILLGDNIYPNGLNKKGSEKRLENESRLKNQLELIKKFKAQSWIIPGNHDWDKHGENGFKAVKRQERFVTKYLGNKAVFLPKNGCPGPDIIKIDKNLVLIIIDTQWLLHKYIKPKGEKDGCNCRDEEEFFIDFKEALKKNRSKNIIVAGHHPLVSNGNHGGRFSLNDHIFPLKKINPNFNFPVPIIGSFYPFYRKYIGHRQDITNKHYQTVAKRFIHEMNQYENIMYVSGHEHNLQYKKMENFHHIVSGSGSKSTFIKRDSRIDFGVKRKGFSKLTFHKNGDVYLKFYSISNQLEPIYQTKLFNQTFKDNKFVKSDSCYNNKTKLIVPNKDYKASKVKELFFGKLNRSFWTDTLTVPYLDLNTYKGGLTPIKQGGGMQTISLRLKDSLGIQYTLRNIKKNATFLTEKKLRGTIAQDILYDGMAGSHPYASLIVSPLAKAANIYYSEPELYYIPKDSNLGKHCNTFGNTVCFLEIRPDKNMEDFPNFGNSKEVINYAKTISKTYKKHNHKVDFEYIVRARLFDMLIGDWDRHDDQWRWATHKDSNYTIYRPIPRDRDQVFFKFNGIIPSIVNRKWLVNKFQPFKPKIRDLQGLNFNARYFDRDFTTQADLDTWVKQATYLQKNITDSIIDSSLDKLKIYTKVDKHNEFKETLKKRRDLLVETATKFYKILAKEVNIKGTYKNDSISITRLSTEKVKIEIYKRESKKYYKPFYTNTFLSKYTKEIRIYGLDGSDIYTISGEYPSKIKIRLIGSKSNNKYIDNTSVKGCKIHIYDSGKKDVFNTNKYTNIHISKKEDHLDFNRTIFRSNKLIPLINLGYNVNDGFISGIGFKYFKQKFNKKPFGTQHSFLINSLQRPEGYRFKYSITKTDFIKNTDFLGELSVDEPLTFHYYGKYNDKKDVDPELVELNIEKISTKFKIPIGKSEIHSFVPGVTFENYSKILNGVIIYNDGINDDDDDEDDNNFKDDDDENDDKYQKDHQSILNNLKLTLEYNLENVNSKMFPTRGISFNTKLNYNYEFKNNKQFLQLKTESKVYIPFNSFGKESTLAVRIGFNKNFGNDYHYYQSNFLSGPDNFRGIERSRFYGRTILFSNFDTHIKLVNINTYLAPFEFGVLGHFDLGKIWQKDAYTDKWKSSVGFGSFVNVLDFIILNGTYTISKNNRLFTLRSSFFF